ncbi:D-aminoacyl-tRNA deacylase [Natronomonas sp. EA1]|uniref:D-aminoacyl-tRNA deacylase n=1 Tax=Natronomonas sp. EA1 TaxID=3421655 RepID=UPI003EBF1A9A
MLAVVVSTPDRASAHIGEQLLALAEWTDHTDDSRPPERGGGTYYTREGMELRVFEKRHLDLENATEPFADPDLLVFASKHAGDTGKLLTVHPTGNFGPADYGGDPNALARAAPNAQKRALEALTEHAPEGYETGIECTHHGPTDIDVPSMFVELGSAEEQWNDPAGAEAVARAILDLDVEPDTDRALVGFGGGHYCPRFERVVRETDWAVGHVAADWGLQAMGDPRENRVVEAAFERTNTRFALVEGEYPELREAIAALGYRAVSESWVRETSGVPLSTVEAVEAELGELANGVALGERAEGFDGGFAVVSLPEKLLAEAVGIDRDAARAAVAERAVAFETEQAGSVPAGRAALPDADTRERVIDALLPILEEKYEAVTREDGQVTAHERAFDPEKARTLGIEEGPAFGKLAAGQAVEVGGRHIDPDAVRTERERVFPLN